MLFAIISGLNAIVAFVGNLFVLLVVAIYNRFHKKRYILLASLALSDLLFAILVVSNRAAANALEQWPFGTTWCLGNAFIVRLLHLTTVFHLGAISHERYTAIVRQPLTYIDNFTKMRIFLYLTFFMVFTGGYIPRSVHRLGRLYLQPRNIHLRAALGNNFSFADIFFSHSTDLNKLPKLQGSQSRLSDSKQFQSCKWPIQHRKQDGRLVDRAAIMLQ